MTQTPSPLTKQPPTSPTNPQTDPLTLSNPPPFSRYPKPKRSMRIKRVVCKKKYDRNAPPTIPEEDTNVDMEDPPLTQPQETPPPTQQPPPSSQPQLSPTHHASSTHTHSPSAQPSPPQHAHTSTTSYHTTKDTSAHDASRSEKLYDKSLFSSFENSEKFKKVF